MLVTSIFIVFICVNGCSSENITIVQNTTHNAIKDVNVPCGVDRLPDINVQEGLNDIESFPWLGLLIYPIDFPSPTTTTIVLITRQMALAPALDIDYYPKTDFRARSRVVVGNNCSGPYIRVLDYTFHPDFTRTTYSTLALVQLETKTLKVFPICPPPAEFENPVEVYVMTLVHDCYNSSMVNVYKMEYMDTTQCRDFYTRVGLDIETMWPTHMACARGTKGGHCIWRSGTALVIRDGGYWKLLGVGTYGPGCESPARFLDYGMYQLWIKRAISRIGMPTITKIRPDHVILRRSTTNIQRYGLCDPEEKQKEIFSERTSFVPPYNIEFEEDGAVKYNVTLLENVDYHCIILQVWNHNNVANKPSITVRRWCTNNMPYCAEFNMKTVYYYVEIKFRHTCTFLMVAYGSEKQYSNAKRLLLYSHKSKSNSSLNNTNEEGTESYLLEQEIEEQQKNIKHFT